MDYIRAIPCAMKVYIPNALAFVNANVDKTLKFIPVSGFVASAAAVNGLKSLTSYVFDKKACTKENANLHRKLFNNLEALKPLIAAGSLLKVVNSPYAKIATATALFLTYLPANWFAPADKKDKTSLQFKAVELLKSVQTRFSQLSDLATQVAAPVLAYRQRNPIVLGATVVNVLTSSYATSLFHKAVDRMRGHDSKSETYNSRSQQNDEYVLRTNVPDDKVEWDTDFEGYKPVEFTHWTVKEQPVWADHSDAKQATWGPKEERKPLSKKPSYIQDKEALKLESATGRPINPMGRTGMTGRGLLGNWGPNTAADPIVFRVLDGKLCMLAIKRGDTGHEAIPGGMVNPGETLSFAAKRELQEETNINIEDVDGQEVYKGYVDDPRNTDNAWMETQAFSFFVKAEDQKVGKQPKAGDDAVGARWAVIDKAFISKLYASHPKFVRKAIEQMLQSGNEELTDDIEVQMREAIKVG